MKRNFRYWVVAGILIFAGSARAQDDTLRVLFIGNSHTYVNNVPALFAGLSQAGGHALVTDMNAVGGYTLLQHTTNQVTLDKIALGTWDYVVIQEHSLYPVIDYYRFESFYPAARVLDSLIGVSGQQTALYMTWGRPNGGLWSIQGHYTIDFADYFQMQDSVSASCRMIADELPALLLPAGDAWATAHHWDSTVALWQSDNIHATLKGSYLAACVFYFVFYQSSPVGLPYYGGLSPEDADFLQRAADATILDISGDLSNPPQSFALFYNFPNPFNSSTSMMFELAQEGRVDLSIYDIAGRSVRTLVAGQLTAGGHKIIWDGCDETGEAVASGVYLSVLRQGSAVSAIRIVLQK